jgi:hypothetical protein
MESIFTILQSIVPNEFPIILYKETNYMGTPELIFELENTIIDNDIKSFYVPGHLRLTLYSHNSNKCNINGPASIPNLHALMLFWDNGNRVEFSQVSQIVPKRILSWNLYLHNILSKKQDLTLNEKPIKFDSDAFFSTICSSSLASQYKCDCFNSYLELSSLYSNTNVYIDLLNANCQPTKQYTHSQSLIATDAKDREKLCISMLNSMITHNTLKPWEHGGPEYFICDSKYYSNMLIEDKTKRFDDEQDKLIELEEMGSNAAFIYFLFILLFFFLVYIIVLACNYVNLNYSWFNKKIPLF